jgi:hypothetical protein
MEEAPTDAQVAQALEETGGDVEQAALVAHYGSIDPLRPSAPDVVRYVDYVAVLPAGFDVVWDSEKPYYTSGRPLTLFYMSGGVLERFMDLRIRKITKFFEENKALKDVADTRYSINEKNVQKWVKALKQTSGTDVAFLRDMLRYTLQSDPADGGLVEQYRSFDWGVVESLASPQTARVAEWLAKRIRFVSARDFYFRLLGMFEKFVAVYAGLGGKLRGVKIVWFMHSGVNRSGTWVSLLLWDAFSPYLNAVVSSAAEIRALETKEGWSKLLIIVPDDALYTGGQITNRISNDMLDRDRNAEDVESDRAFFIAAPFWSSRAQSSVVRQAKSVFFPDLGTPNEDMQTINELLKKTPPKERDKVDPRSKKAFDFGFGLDLHTGHVPTFFAHKLPDFISVPNNLFALAPYFEIDDAAKTVTVKFTTLIKGCSPENYEYSQSQDDAQFNDFVQGPDTVCPYPPYKQFNWTYNGQPVDKSAMPVEVLDALSYP